MHLLDLKKLIFRFSIMSDIYIIYMDILNIFYFYCIVDIYYQECLNVYASFLIVMATAQGGGGRGGGGGGWSMDLNFFVSFFSLLFSLLFPP